MCISAVALREAHHKHRSVLHRWNHLSTFLFSAHRQRSIYWLEWNRSIINLRHWECFINRLTSPDFPPPVARPIWECPGGVYPPFSHWEHFVKRLTDPDYNISKLKVTRSAWRLYWASRRPAPIGARKITKEEAFERFISVHKKRTARAAALL